MRRVALAASAAVLLAAALASGAGEGHSFYPLPSRLLLVAGTNPSDTAGAAVAGVGDVNGDGIVDAAVGIPGRTAAGRDEAGVVLVTFGARGGDRTISVDNATGPSLTIVGAEPLDHAGATIAPAGDFNGDGLDDILVGAPGAAPDDRSAAGIAYVVFGRRSGGTVDLAALGPAAIVIRGAARGDLVGSSVAGVGDLNRDGRAEVLVGAASASPLNRAHAGAVYLIRGRRAGGVIDLAAPTGTVTIAGAEAGDGAGSAVASAGDFDGDGYRDVVVGAPASTAAGAHGTVYVLHGPFTGDRDLADLAAARGVAIRGSAGRPVGAVVAGAGDVNGDGRDDVAIGSPDADIAYRTSAGAGFVLYGTKARRPIVLGKITSRQGFMIAGAEGVGRRRDGDRAGSAIAGAGDYDGDGLDDVLIGVPGLVKVLDRRGGAYVVFGSRRGRRVDLAHPGDSALRMFDPGAAAVLTHADRFGAAVASAGDLSGDGLPDILVGAPDAQGARLAGGKPVAAAGRAVLLAAPRMRILRGLTRVSGTIEARATCLSPTRVCRGTVTVRSASRLRCGGRSTSGPTPVAEGRFSVRPRHTGVLSARFGPRAQRLVRCFLEVPVNVLLRFDPLRRG